MNIAANYTRIRQDIGRHVTIVVAAKTRTADQLREVIEAGAADIGENYVQEAEKMVAAIGKAAEAVRWHLIGPLQKNKINKALGLFDVIQTVDSFQKAQAIDKRVEKTGKKVVPVLIEINIGDEQTKTGVRPLSGESLEESVEAIVRQISVLDHLRIEGLMTMGMTHSYKVAIEEGANMVRIGTAIFGSRQCDQV